MLQVTKNEANSVKKRQDELGTAVAQIQIDKAKPVTLTPLLLCLPAVGRHLAILRSVRPSVCLSQPRL